MRFLNANNFNTVNEWVAFQLNESGRIVDVGEWQAVQKDIPQALTIEVEDLSFEMPIGPDLKLLQSNIRPNLPWAEDHFQERVSGIPYNPPPSHEWWPFAQKSNAAHTEPSYPELDEREWAYLAALIDGEGSLNFHQTGREQAHRQSRITIGQVERTAEYEGGALITALQQKFGVGKVRRVVRSGLVPPSGVAQPTKTFVRWEITSPPQVKWLLLNCLPYLQLKKDKAKKLLDNIFSKNQVMSHPLNWPPDAPPRFSHTYPERFWPPRGYGIRSPYGNLGDVVKLLQERSGTRQAYLPVWYPEDTGAMSGGRLPCSLGYHFLIRRGNLKIVYYIRSCDFYRHFRDDVYMAARLGQWVAEKVQVQPFKLVMHISSMHIFAIESIKLQKEVTEIIARKMG